MAGNQKPRAVLVCLATFTLWGCQEQRDDVKQAVEAAKALSDLAQQGQRAKEAASAAEKAARAQIAEGTDPKAAEQQVELAKNIAAMKAMAGGGGPAVNWRELAPLLPESIAGFQAKGELDGSTKKMSGFEVSEVKRRYEVDKRRLSIEITDASTHMLMRAPFAMVAMVEEDSTQGFKKGKTVAGHPAIIEWKAKSKSSTASLLVANRFIVNVRASGGDNDSEAETIAAGLKLDELAKLAAAAPAQANAAK